MSDNGQRVPLPGCMIGPSEPCDAFQRQTDRIAELEAALQAGRDLMAIVHGDGGHYREAHGDRKAADDAIAIVSKLRVDLDAERERREAAEAALRELASVDGAGGCAAVAVFIGIPLAMFGTLVLIEFWPERKD
jgi:hypothetical protein